MISDKFPLPTVEELSAKFYGSTVFSKLDLQQGYPQVQLHPDSPHGGPPVHLHAVRP